LAELLAVALLRLSLLARMERRAQMAPMESLVKMAQSVSMVRPVLLDKMV
jgi:hypothetical protein